MLTKETRALIDELLELSARLGLTGAEALAQRPVHWLIEINEQGQFMGLSPTVTIRASKKRGREPEEVQGKLFDAPVFYFATVSKEGEVTATAGGGKAVAELGIGNVAEVFGVKIDSKRGEPVKVTQLAADDANKHTNFLALHQKLADSLPDNTTVQATWRYLSSQPTIPHDRISESQLKKLAKQQLSFRVAEHPLLTDPEVLRWWKDEFARWRSNVLEALPDGRDIFPLSKDDDCRGKLALVFPPIAGVPDGGAWCPLTSTNMAPTASYGLGKNTLPMRLETAEKACAALNWLLSEPSTHLDLGDKLVAVFWGAPSRRNTEIGSTPNFVDLMSDPDPLEVRTFLNATWSSQSPTIEVARFQAAILSSPQSRITVRSWHTKTLIDATANLKRWFNFVEVPTSQYRNEDASEFVRIGRLAECTIRPPYKGEKQPPKPMPPIYSALFQSALFGGEYPAKLLLVALSRQRLELAKGSKSSTPKDCEEFDNRMAARTALIQLSLGFTKGAIMSNDPKLEGSAGYWCGRLLAILDRIHIEAHDSKTSSSPANRSYGSASTMPALIFPQLCKLVRVHLDKVKGKRDSHGNKAEERLEFGYPQFNPPLEGLAEVCAKLRTTGAEFPRTLTLEQQGHFAIGFYYERCLRWPAFNAGNQKANDTSPELE